MHAEMTWGEIGMKRDYEFFFVEVQYPYLKKNYNYAITGNLSKSVCL